MLNKMCFWNDFFSAVSATGHEYVVKDIIEPQAKQTEVNADKYTELHCTKEDYMVYAFLLSKTRYRVFISATMGGKAAFEENEKFIFLAVCHMKSGNREDAFFPCDFVDLIEGHHDFSVFWGHG